MSAGPNHGHAEGPKLSRIITNNPGHFPGIANGIEAGFGPLGMAAQLAEKTVDLGLRGHTSDRPATEHEFDGIKQRVVQVATEAKVQDPTVQGGVYRNGTGRFQKGQRQ